VKITAVSSPQGLFLERFRVEIEALWVGDPAVLSGFVRLQPVITGASVRVDGDRWPGSGDLFYAN
jgi:hypothetical protein